MMLKTHRMMLKTHRKSHDLLQERCSHCAGYSVGMCHVMAEADLAELAVEAERLHHIAGSIVVQEGTKAHGFYVLVSGRLKIFNLLPDGRRQITSFMEAGSFMGLMASENYAFSAEAMEEVILCHFPRQVMARLIKRFPALEQHLMAAASKELVRLQERVVLLGRKTARERVATFLLERAQMAGLPLHIPQVHLPMSRGDIADYLGLSIETVSRVIHGFKQEKLININGICHITLLNIPCLLGIARGEMACGLTSGRAD